MVMIPSSSYTSVPTRRTQNNNNKGCPWRLIPCRRPNTLLLLLLLVLFVYVPMPSMDMEPSSMPIDDAKQQQQVEPSTSDLADTEKAKPPPPPLIINLSQDFLMQDIVVANTTTTNCGFHKCYYKSHTHEEYGYLVGQSRPPAMMLQEDQFLVAYNLSVTIQDHFQGRLSHIYPSTHPPIVLDHPSLVLIQRLNLPFPKTKRYSTTSPLWIQVVRRLPNHACCLVKTTSKKWWRKTQKQVPQMIEILRQQQQDDIPNIIAHWWDQWNMTLELVQRVEPRLWYDFQFWIDPTTGDLIQLDLDRVLFPPSKVIDTDQIIANVRGMFQEVFSAVVS